MPDITAAQARDIYNNLETWLVTILKTQSDITDLLGEDGDGESSIEAGLRNEIRDYMDAELPAIVVFADGSDDDDNEGEGLHTEIVVPYDLSIFTISNGGDLKEVKNKVQQIVAEVEHYLRQQLNSTDDLSQTIGGTANALVKIGTTTFEALVADDEQVFRVVGRTNLTVTLDLDAG